MNERGRWLIPGMAGRRRVVTGALATMTVALTLAGCGGSPSSVAQPASSPPGGAASAPATSPEATSVVSTSGGPGGGGLCGLIRTYHQRIADLAAQGLGDPGRMRQLMTAVVSALDQAVGIAPADIRADLNIIRDATKQYDALLSSAGYDPTKMTRGVEDPLLRPDVQAASERQGTYAHDTCGIQD